MWWGLPIISENLSRIFAARPDSPAPWLLRRRPSQDTQERHKPPMNILSAIMYSILGVFMALFRWISALLNPMLDRWAVFAPIGRRSKSKLIGAVSVALILVSGVWLWRTLKAGSSSLN